MVDPPRSYHVGWYTSVRAPTWQDFDKVRKELAAALSSRSDLEFRTRTQEDELSSLKPRLEHAEGERRLLEGTVGELQSALSEAVAARSRLETRLSEAEDRERVLSSDLEAGRDAHAMVLDRLQGLEGMLQSSHRRDAEARERVEALEQELHVLAARFQRECSRREGVLERLGDRLLACRERERAVATIHAWFRAVSASSNQRARLCLYFRMYSRLKQMEARHMAAEQERDQETSELRERLERTTQLMQEASANFAETERRRQEERSRYEEEVERLISMRLSAEEANGQLRKEIEGLSKRLDGAAALEAAYHQADVQLEAARQSERDLRLALESLRSELDTALSRLQQEQHVRGSLGELAAADHQRSRTIASGWKAFSRWRRMVRGRCDRRIRLTLAFHILVAHQRTQRADEALARQGDEQAQLVERLEASEAAVHQLMEEKRQIHDDLREWRERLQRVEAEATAASNQAGRQLHEARMQTSVLETEVAGLKCEVARLQGSLTTAEREAQTARDNLSGLQEQKAKEQAVLNGQIHSLETEVTTLADRVAFLTERGKELQQAAETAQASLAHVQEEKDRQKAYLEGKIASSETKVVELTSRVAFLTERSDELQKAASRRGDDLARQLDEKSAEIRSLRERQDGERARYEALQAVNDNLRATISGLSQERDAESARVDALSLERDQLSDEVQRLQGWIASFEVRESSLEAREQSLRQYHEEAKANELAAAVQARARAETEAALLRDRVASLDRERARDAKLRQKLEATEAELSSARQAKGQAEEELRHLRERVVGLERANAGLQERSSHLHEELSVIRTPPGSPSQRDPEAPGLRERVEALQREVNEARRARSEAEGELRVLRERLVQLERTNAALQERANQPRDGGHVARPTVVEADLQALGGRLAVVQGELTEERRLRQECEAEVRSLRQQQAELQRVAAVSPRRIQQGGREPGSGGMSPDQWVPASELAVLRSRLERLQRNMSEETRLRMVAEDEADNLRRQLMELERIHAPASPDRAQQQSAFAALARRQGSEEASELRDRIGTLEAEIAHLRRREAHADRRLVEHNQPETPGPRQKSYEQGPATSTARDVLELPSPPRFEGLGQIRPQGILPLVSQAEGLEELRAALRRVEADKAQLQEQLGEARHEVLRLSQEVAQTIEALRSEASPAQEHELRSTVADLQARVVALEEENRRLRQQLDLAQQGNEALSKQLEEASVEVREMLAERASEMSDMLARTELQSQRADKRVAEVMAEVAQREERLGSMREELRALTALMKEKTSDVVDREDHIASLCRELEAAQGKTKNLEETVQLQNEELCKLMQR
jgi:golgin subfamily B member 1